jgi:MFS family permease
MRLPTGLRALQHRDFRIFWTGQLVSLVGTWMQTVAQAWLVLELTDSPFKLGLIGTLQFAPMLVLSIVAGVIADRLPKRRIVLTSQTVLGVQALTLAALVGSGHVRYWHVAVLATVLGIANTLDLPARQSFIVEMVGKRDLLNAIALNSALFNGARVVGPAIAGLVIARYGTALAFLLNGLSFLAVIAALTAVRSQGLPHPSRGQSMPADILEGVAYAVRTPRVTLVLSLLCVVSVCLLNYNTMVPLLARQVLGQAAPGFGVLMAALGIGAVSGAVTLAALGRGRPPLAALVGPAVVLAVTTLGLAAVRQVWLAAVLLALMGYSGILFMAGSNTTLQVTVPDTLRGRMMSLYAMVFAGVTPIGALWFGWVSEAFGVPAALLTGGAVGLGAVLALVGWWARRHRTVMR